MGLFGSKKTYVASTVYNMAGDELKRLNFLKTAVVGSIIGTNKYSTADVIQSVFLPGPGIQSRSFFRWALEHYQGIGVPTGTLGGVFNLDSSAVVPYLPVDVGQTAVVVSLSVGPTDFSYWAEKWMMENHPDKMGLAWVADLLPNGTQIVITYPDATTDTFAPPGMTQGEFVYVVYTPTDTAGAIHDSRYWIYRIGSGNAVLDAAVAHSHTSGEWLPTIPFRIDNNFLSANYNPAAYELAKKAYRKASGRKKYSTIVDKIADNASLSEIDHAYMTYGVCLNVRENACRQYIFRLFDRLVTGQAYSSADFNAYANDVLNYTQTGGNVPIAPTNSLRVRSQGPMLSICLDFEIRWQTMSKLRGVGLVRPGVHKRGDYWIEKGSAPVASPAGTINAGGTPLGFSGTGFEKITIYRQASDTRWQAIEVTGLKHLNHIYQDKSVEITAWEALDDADDTGFIVPLHYETLRQMSLVKSTQMMTAATFMVFNSQKTVKTKWYQTIIFKIFIFIVIIAITVVTMGSGTAPAVGVLGSALAVGTAVGLSGVLAVIVGAIINALVAMIIAKIIGMVSVELFGAKWGAIIGAIVTMVVLAGATGFANGQSLSAVWGSMMNPISIINMTSSVGNGIVGYMQASVAETMGKIQDLNKDYNKQSKDISDKLAELYGGSRGTIDPLDLVNIGQMQFFESEQAFLSRTLMTGTDIANMTQDMLNNFTSYTTALPTPN